MWSKELLQKKIFKNYDHLRMHVSCHHHNISRTTSSSNHKCNKSNKRIDLKFIVRTILNTQNHEQFKSGEITQPQAYDPSIAPTQHACLTKH